MTKDFIKVNVGYVFLMAAIWGAASYFVMVAIEENPINTNKYLMCEDNNSKVASNNYGIGADKVLLYTDLGVLEYKKENCKFVKGE